VIPPEYAAFVDDAAIFPPGNAHLGDAVRDFRANAAAPYASLVGPFVVSDVRIPDLLEVLTLSPGDPLPVTVVVTGGAGGIEPASRWASGSDLLELRSLEIALRDLDDLGGNARRVAAAVDAGLDVPVYVEPPISPDLVGGHGWSAALDVVAEHGLRLKWRTGGATADVFPTAGTLATALDAALDRELPFKCTAGLHHALRHRDETTGFEQHGFLNVLLATRAAFDGAGADEVAAVLEERDGETVRDRLDTTGSEALVRTRRWFTSFGCCGVLDPLEDLLELGLVHLGTPHPR
jgi:hypothetical protein